MTDIVATGRLEGRPAIVTGAGRGIGRGIALALAAEGAPVAVAELDPAGAEATVALIVERGGTAIAVPTDVRDPESILACVRRTVGAFGGLRILVNNAMAAQVDTPIIDTTDEALDLAVDTGLRATLRFLRASFPHLRGDGRVINLRSGSELTGQRGMASYVSAKGAIAALTRVAANEWGEHGVTVNAIMPISFGEGTMQWFDAHPEVYTQVLSRQAIKRGGDAEADIGRTAVYLASDDAAFVTGCTINVDGGGVFLS